MEQPPLYLSALGRGDYHHGMGTEPGKPALDIEEFFGPQIGTKPGFRNAVIPQLQGQLRGPDRIASMGDIGKRPAVHDNRGPFDRLHQVRVDSVLEQGSHRALGLEIPGIYRPAGIGAGYKDIPQPAASNRRCPGTGTGLPSPRWLR